MSTRKSQRIGIWVIAVVLTIGTLASFIAIVLAPANKASDQTKLTDLSNEYKASQDEHQKKVDAQAAELTKQYFSDFNQYASRPAPFDKAGVTTLTTNDLKIGTGADINAGSSFTAYYIGWNSNGEIFDESIAGTSLKAPIAVTPGGVIEGWTEGVVGMKVGGVRELSIPSDKAYKDKAQGDKIPANSPLKFIIMIIPTPEAIPDAAVPPELLKYYTNGGHF